MQRQWQAAARAAQALLVQQQQLLQQQQWHGIQAFSAAASAAAAATASKQPAAADASIHVACVLERLPVVAGPAPAWESDFQGWLIRQEIKHGLRSDYPHVKHIYAPMSESNQAHQQLQEQQQQEARGGQDAADSQDEQQGLQQSAAAAQQLPDQVPETPADKAGDKKSMRRALASRLYLLVRQGDAWHFPQATVRGNESIRNTCRRALVSTIGRRYPFFFIGNAPMAHVELPQDGGKLFFMLAQVVDDPWGPVHLAADGGASDYMWATREEAQQQLTEKRVAELVPRMLLA